MAGEERKQALDKGRQAAGRKQGEKPPQSEREALHARQLQRRAKVMQLQRQRRREQVKRLLLPVCAVVMAAICVALFVSASRGKKTPGQAEVIPKADTAAETFVAVAANDRPALVLPQGAAYVEPSAGDGKGEEAVEAARQAEPTTAAETSTAKPTETAPQDAPITQPEETVPQEATVTQTAQTTPSETPAVPPVDAAPVEVPVSQTVDPSGIVLPSWITPDLLHINDVSRPYLALSPVQDIVIHYVANPGSTAKGNRDYFDSLDNPNVVGAFRQASAHLVVGLDGEVIQCIPFNEVAYANYPRNYDTISIEVCHPDDTGQFSHTTYQTVVKLAAWLLQQLGLDPSHVIRHYDCNGKSCPKYYVENPAAWEQLKADISAYYYAHPNIQ